MTATDAANLADNNLPDGWVWVKLDNLIGPKGVFIDGDWVESKDQNPDGEIRLIQLADIGDGFFRNRSDRFMDYERAIELNCTFLEKDDILIARMPDPLGRACLFPFSEKIKYVTVVDVAIIRPGHELVSSKLLLFFINSPRFRNSINALQTGTTRKRISRGNLSTLPFPLPPLPEQHRIVAKLERLFARLARAEEHLRQSEAALERYRQSVLKTAFSATDAEGKMKDGWKWVRLGEVLDTINNGYTPKPDKMTSGKGQIPFIKVYNLTFDGSFDFSKNPTFIDEETHKKELKRSITYPGDVLINIVGPPLGKVSVVPSTYPEWNINQAIVLFRPNGKVRPKFLCYFLQNPKTIEWLISTSKATAGQFNVKVSTCREIPFPEISIAKQERIIDFVETALTRAAALHTAIVQARAECARLRQSILREAFAGRLVPQQAGDEPAGVLLERIRREREKEGKNGRKR